MSFLTLNCISALFYICLPSYLILAQQPYARTATTICDIADNSTSVLGYSCNGVSSSCQSYLSFRSHPPYDTVESISSLLGANSSQVSHINSVPENQTFQINKLVIVPVRCSCAGDYYQAKTSYVIAKDNSFLLVANNTFQGLSTCQALKSQNGNLSDNLSSGTRIIVPLRCACPTRNQTHAGFKYLLSYLVTWGNYVWEVSQRFNVSVNVTLAANSISFQAPTIYPFTTLLVPLKNPPSSSETFYSPPPPPPYSPTSSFSGSPPSSANPKRTWVYILVGVLVGSSLAILFVVTIFCAALDRAKKKSSHVLDADNFEVQHKKVDKIIDEQTSEFLKSSVPSAAQSLKMYTYEELQSATEDFSPSCCIKGSVYCGRIDGTLAAIKRMDGEVSKEINILNKINHHNIIRLFGLGFNDGHWYLVYEYAMKGPLSDWIFDPKKSLSWTQRIQIALDVATGLNYLHGYTSPPNVHQDIKSSNILLDGCFRAKIASFSSVRTSEGQEGEFARTRNIIGTRGYMPPEYLEIGLVSTKLDVYSFGVLLLEIFTGKEAETWLRRKNKNLSEILDSFLNAEDAMENLKDLMDPSLQANYPFNQAIFMIKLIDSCLSKDPAARPSMDEIVPNLSRILDASRSWDMSNNVAEYRSFIPSA